MQRALKILFVTLTSSAAAQELEVRAVSLRVDTVIVAPTRVLLQAAVRDVSGVGEFAVLSAGRELWRMSLDGSLAALHRSASLPSSADWFATTCSAGDRVLVEVSAYPEERLKQDLAVPRGGFRGGPDPLGIAVVTRDSLRFVRSFRVTEVWPGIAPSYPGDSIPTEVTPLPQSCHWTGRELVVGAYGFTAAVNLRTETARLLARDGELSFNRHAVLLMRDSLWTALDEGGASGGCLELAVRGSRPRDYCVLNLNNSELGVDALVSADGVMLTGSAAGIVALRIADSSFTHYQFGTDKQKMEAYGLRCEAGRILGLRDDGLVISSLAEGRATLVRFAPDELNTIYGLARVGQEWVVAADSVAFVARIPVPMSPPTRRSC